MELSKIDEAARNAYRLIGELESINDNREADNTKPVEDWNFIDKLQDENENKQRKAFENYAKDLFSELSTIEAGLMDWTGDTKNTGICFVIQENRLNDLPLKVTLLTFRIGLTDIALESKNKYSRVEVLAQCESVCNRISKDLKKFAVPVESGKPQQPTTQRPAMRHYTSKDTPEHYKMLFNDLKKESFFDDTANLETWLYICGHGDYKPTYRPLNWLKSPTLLTIVIDYLFTKHDKEWAIAVSCFTENGKKLNAGNLAKNLSIGLNTENKEYKKLMQVFKLWEQNIKIK
jgi:hypothetical protein